MRPKNTHTQPLLLPNLLFELALLDTPPPYPTINNPIPTYQSQVHIHQAQAQPQQQQQQKNTLDLLPYSGFIRNALLQPELLNNSNTPHFSTQPINFASTNRTSSYELP